MFEEGPIFSNRHVIDLDPFSEVHELIFFEFPGFGMVIEFSLTFGSKGGG